MKFKPILADPATLYDAGLRVVSHVVLLVHLGRCGLQGATVGSCAHALKRMPEGTIYSVLEKLRAAGWVIHYCRQNSQGRAGRYVISVKGWELLTRQPDFSMFPDAGVVIKETEGVQ